MKKRLTNQLSLYFYPNFPRRLKVRSNKKHTIVLGIGGNIGDVKQRFDKLFLLLCHNRYFEITQTSPLLLNPPFGYTKQDDYLNALMVLKTNLSPIGLLNIIQRYEKRFKRVRSFQDAPRTLDIDIIFYDNIKFNNKRLTIPHKSWKDRKSITIPKEYLCLK